MKVFLHIARILILVSCGIMMSCFNQNDVDGGCQTKQFKGVLTVDRIDTEFDGRHNLRTVYGTFNATDSGAPKELKPANVKQGLGYPENSNISTNQKYYTTATYVISGSCPKDVVLESPDKWKEVEY